MTAAPHYAALGEVIEWRRNARPGEWVSFAGGDPLDRKHPVVALVRGWQRQGLVEIASDTMPTGWQRHRFRRTKSDFPAGWFDPPPPGPIQPPSRRDPQAVGLGGMVHWAAAGDENPGWVRFAATALAQEIGGLSAYIHGSKDRHDAAKAALPAKFDETLAETELLLITLAEMLDPAGETKRRARIGWRGQGGGKVEGQRWAKLLETAAAAAGVEAAVAAGTKKDSAVRAAAKPGLSETAIKARLAVNRRARAAREGAPAAEAAQLVTALRRGGLLEAAAVREVAAVSGLSPAAIRKALKE